MGRMVWTLVALYAAPLLIGTLGRITAKAFRGEASTEAAILLSLICAGLFFDWLRDRRARREAGK